MGPAVGPFHYRIWKHRDNPPGVRDSDWDQSSRIAQLSEGCKSFSTDIPGLPQRDFTGWLLVDARGKVNENNEENNAASDQYSIGDASDLYVKSLDPVATGNRVKVNCEICNRGPAPGSFTLGFWLNRDTAPTVADRWSADEVVFTGGLGADDCRKESSLPRDMEDGEYTAWVFIDSFGEFDEANEGDNIASAQYSVPAEAPLCNGLPATLIGTDGDDDLTGTSDDDVIVGLGGKDLILGLAGNDVICAGPGNDTVRGGSGKDWISGGAGRDKLQGNGGRDVIRGDTGNDTIFGGSSADKLFGGANNDKLFGQNGNDKLRCGGDDSGNGGDGQDTTDGTCEVEVNIP